MISVRFFIQCTGLVRFLGPGKNVKLVEIDSTSTNCHQFIRLSQAPVYKNLPSINAQYNELKSFMEGHSFFYAPIFSRDVSMYKKCLHYHDVAKIYEISCETAAAWKWSTRMSPFHWVTLEYSLFLNIIETETKVLV